MAGSMWHDDRNEIDYSAGRRGRGRGGSDRYRGSGGGRRERERSPPRRRGGGDRSPAAPGCKIFVGNLAYRVSWQDLKDHMRQAGEVSFARVMMGADGRSKGCGIVEYENPDDASEAIRMLHDTELKGRAIFVREDQEPTDHEEDRRPRREDRAPRSRIRDERGGGRLEERLGGKDRSDRRERGERNRKEEITAEKLDEDLDRYFSTKSPKVVSATAEVAPSAEVNDDIVADEAVEEVLEDME